MKFLYAMLLGFACCNPCMAEMKADAAYGVAYIQEQVVELPQDQFKPYITVFGNPSDARYQAVVKWFDTNQTLATIKDGTHFNVIPTNSVMFRDRYAATTPNALVVRLQAVDVDQPIVELVGNQVPMTADALANHLNSTASSAECFRRQRCEPAPNTDPKPQPLSPPAPPVAKSGPIWPCIVAVIVSSLGCFGIGIAREWRKSNAK